MKKTLLLSALSALPLIFLPLAASAQTTDTTSTSQAAEPTVLTEDEALAIDAKIYADSYGVSFDEALKRLLIMQDSEKDIATTASEEGTDYAGRYFDNSAGNFGLTIRTKKANKMARNIMRKGNKNFNAKFKDPKARAEQRLARKNIRQKFKISDAQVEAAENAINQDSVLPVKYNVNAQVSIAQQNEVIKNNYKAINDIKGFQMVYPDEKTGEIVVMVHDTNAAPIEKKLKTIINTPFRVELVSGEFQDTSIRGGQYLYIVSSNERCMSGFSAMRISDGVTGIVTAGHCHPQNLSGYTGNNTATIKDNGNGVVKTIYMPVNMWDAGHYYLDYQGVDLMFVADKAVPAVGEFYYGSTSAVRKVTGTRSRTSTNTSNGDAYTKGTTTGTFVCHLGQEVHGSLNFVQTCGEVVSVAGGAKYNIYNTNDQSLAGNYVMVRNTQSGAGTIRTSGEGTLKCYQGDSGGPWFAGTIAYGIHSKCLWVNNVKNGIAAYGVYTSVDNFPKIGVSIVQ